MNTTPPPSPTTTPPPSTQRLTLEEEEKELLFWESQYSLWFEKVEKRLDAIKKYHFLNSMMKFNLHRTTKQ